MEDLMTQTTKNTEGLFPFYTDLPHANAGENSDPMERHVNMDQELSQNKHSEYDRSIHSGQSQVENDSQQNTHVREQRKAQVQSATPVSQRNEESNRVTFTIFRQICILSKNANDWTREVNLVSWNGRPTKLDIRSWSPDHTRMSRGIGLSGVEVGVLMDALEDVNIADLNI